MSENSYEQFNSEVVEYLLKKSDNKTQEEINYLKLWVIKEYYNALQHSDSQWLFSPIDAKKIYPWHLRRLIKLVAGVLQDWDIKCIWKYNDKNAGKKIIHDDTTCIERFNEKLDKISTQKKEIEKEIEKKIKSTIYYGDGARCDV